MLRSNQRRRPYVSKRGQSSCLREYPRNPRKNDAAVDRLCTSIREFSFKIPCLIRGDGEIVNDHLRLKAALKLGISKIPVILCDEWTPAQVKAFQLLVNRASRVDVMAAVQRSRTL